ncbi:MAG: EAL domain-containing protein [Actinobacteria bacterium]|nr:EAL domain-containing protein [Actinomycetota bacterium]
MRRGRAWGLRAGEGAAVALVALAVVFPRGGAHEALYLVAVWFAALVAWGGRLGRRPADGTPWTWLAAGVTLSAAADTVWSAYGWITHRPTPDLSLADPVYLVATAAVAAAVLGFDRRTSRGRGGDSLIDAAQVGVVAALLGWELLLRPTLADGQMSVLAGVVAASYPMLDLVVLVLVVRLVAERPHRSTSGLLLVTGLSCWLVADTAYALVAASAAYDTWVPWLDALWMASVLTMGMAATRADMAALTAPVRESGEPGLGLGRRRLALSVSWLAAPGLAAGIGGLLGRAPSSAALIGGTVVLAVLVLLRCLRLLRDNETARAELRARERHYQALARNSSDAATLLDRDGRILGDQPALAAFLGRPRGSTDGLDVFAFLDADNAATARTALERAVRDPGRRVDVELPVAGADRQVHWVAARLISLLDDPDVGAVVVNLHDVTDRKVAEAELSHQAFHDPLTGLANRSLFRERITYATTWAHRHRVQLAVLFLDLDGFKTVNDGLGHDVGDDLLRLVAARLGNAVRPGQTVARLGGDEFGVLVEATAGAVGEAIATADRILQVLGDPFSLRGRMLTVSASIGIAVGEGLETVDTLLRNADVAMYHAKAAGRGRRVLFSPSMRQGAEERLRLEGDLTGAVARGELVLRYQPVVDLGTGRVRGFEALLRWDHPDLGLVTPDRFIPLAEANGMIVPIGRWVLREACRAAAAWQSRHPAYDRLAMAVNLSARQLDDPRLIGDVVDALTEAGLRPRSLILELTETALVDDAQAAARTLTTLNQLGVQLAVDDFGTGYSSLSHLRQFPVDILKIDRSFTSAIVEGEPTPGIVQGVLELARALKLRLVAEGIETPAQAERLRDEGCHMGQGYLFARPLVDEDAEAMLVEVQRPARLPLEGVAAQPQPEWQRPALDAS